jgi:hypothetical protein
LASGGGGGGSSYLANLTNSSASAAGTTFTPGGASDPNYVAGIAVGSNENIAIGHGQVVLIYDVVPEPAAVVTALLGIAGLVIIRRCRNGSTRA